MLSAIMYSAFAFFKPYLSYLSDQEKILLPLSLKYRGLYLFEIVAFKSRS